MISNTTEIVSFSCHKGYSLTGASNSTCTIFGNWSDPVPNCDAITNESVSSPISVIIGATVGGVLLLIMLTVIYFANCKRRNIYISKIHGQNKKNAEEYEHNMELNPMHATFDKRKIHTTFLYEETSADESDWRDLTQQSHIHNNVSGLTVVGESPLFELANSTLGDVCDVSTAMHSSSEISNYPYYSPLQKPDDSLYEPQEPVTSEAKFSTSSEKTDASDNYAHLVSLPGASRMDSSTMYAELMSHDIMASVCESCSL